MAPVNVICIKWGKPFGPEYVNRLYAGCRRHTAGDLRFLCVTDDRTGIRPEVEVIPLVNEPFHGAMMAALDKAARKGCPVQKITMRRPDLVPDLDGPLLTLDLDVLITGPLDDLMTFAPGKVCMRRVWAKPSRHVGLGHGSVIRTDPKRHAYLYDRMAADPETEIIRAHGSEQSYISWAAQDAGDLAFYPDAWIASFKYDCRPVRPLNLVMPPRLPADTRIVAFHGRPKMAEAIAGYRAGPLHSTKPARWMTEAWSE